MSHIFLREIHRGVSVRLIGATPLAVDPELARGKVCLVTGATSGIGLAIARGLAACGATVILVGRSEAKCATLVARIKQETGNPSVEPMLADLASQREIRRLADEVKTRYPRLDILVNNAGALFFKRRESQDGIETTFALNHLGYFMLTNLLLDSLHAAAPSRLINVSSISHMSARLDFQDLQATHKYDGYQAYCRSKLANVLFTYELARRLGGTSITVNAMDPGWTATNFGLNNFGITRGRGADLVRRVLGFFALSPEEGARTAIYLATAAEVEGVTGKYFERQVAVRSSPESYDVDAAARLWEASVKMTGVGGDL